MNEVDLNDVILYVSLGIAGLLLLLLFWRRGTLEGSGGQPRALSLPAAAVVDRVFSPEDLRYAQSLPKSIYKLFVRDRRAMAMTWIRQIRYTSVLLMRRHVQTVRHSSSLRILTEARIAASFVGILLGCEIFALGVATLGPVRMKALISPLAMRIQSLQAELGRSSLTAGYETA